MTKTYTMPTWEEFLAAHPAASGSKHYAEVRGPTFEMDYTVLPETYEAIREALAVEPPESERLVGAARGETRDEFFGIAVGREAWADAGGGEEKPVRAVDPEPVADHPRCGNCKCWESRTPDNDVGDCRRFPAKITKGSHDHCGEWRAK